jgi:hypothetical protein
VEAHVIAYKFLRADGSSVFTSFDWPLPASGPGAWVEAPADPCRSGIHACRVADLPYWAGRTLYEIELGGELIEQPTKLIGTRGRLVRRVAAWDEQRDAYTRMCADRAHELVGAAPPEFSHWDSVVEPSIPEGPALLGFVAARIAEEIAGSGDAYHAERERQAGWLAKRLGLSIGA